MIRKALYTAELLQKAFLKLKHPEKEFFVNRKSVSLFGRSLQYPCFAVVKKL